MVDNLFIDFR